MSDRDKLVCMAAYVTMLLITEDLMTATVSDAKMWNRYREKNKRYRKCIEMMIKEVL